MFGNQQNRQTENNAPSSLSSPAEKSEFYLFIKQKFLMFSFSSNSQYAFCLSITNEIHSTGMFSSSGLEDSKDAMEGETFSHIKSPSNYIFEREIFPQNDQKYEWVNFAIVRIWNPPVCLLLMDFIPNFERIHLNSFHFIAHLVTEKFS